MSDVKSNLFEFSAEYQIIFDYLNDLICIVESEGDYRFEMINENAFVRLLGYLNEDLVGKSFLNIVYREDINQVINVFKKKLEFVNNIQAIRLKHKNGAHVWVECKVKKFKDDRDQKKLLLILRDISERKKLEERLANYEDKLKKLTNSIPEIRFWKLFEPKKHEEAFQSSLIMLQTIMENIPQYIFWKDKNLIYLGCNHNYANFIGLDTPEDLIGKTDMDLFEDKEKANNLHEHEMKIINSDMVEYHEEELWVQEGGSGIWFDVNRIPYHDSKGKILGILVTYENITNRKIAEDKLMESELKYRDMAEKYCQLFEKSPFSILLLDVNGFIVDCNPATETTIGVKKKDIIGKKCYDSTIIHPKYVPLILEQIKKVVKEGELPLIDIQIYNKDGHLIWVSIKSSLMKFGTQIYIQVIAQDITKRKMYENLIYELNVNFLNFTAHVQGNIELLLNTCLKLLNADLVLFVHKRMQEEKTHYLIITSENKTYTYNSEDFENNLFANELFKANNDLPQIFLELQDMKYTKIDPFLKNNNFKGAIGKLMKSEDQFDNAICIFYRENPIMTHEYKLVLFLICDAIGIELRRWIAQLQLEDQNKKLSEINQFKTDLFSRTSHELKTPLISIKGFTELLLTLYKDRLDLDTISILEEIKNGSNRLEKIIHSLLEGSKIEQDKLKLIKTREDLAFLIRFCVNELNGQAKLRNQKISINVHEKLETNFDKERIYEVIANLLINAINYTPPNGEIKIQSEINDNFYIISISDNGIGFTGEEIKQIFKQFGKIERYGKGLDVEIEGTGLGLFISKKIVELHGGNIWVESEGRNKGSTFYFSLPIATD